MAAGWPFLVARGRRSGHRILLAPDFLVAAGDYGVLEQVNGGTGVVVLTSAAGHRLSVAYATHPVGPAEVDDPRDEHGRPLQLIYGLVAAGPADAQEQMGTALALAIEVYRRFLRAEGGFAVVPSTSLELPDDAQPVAGSPDVPGRMRLVVAAAALVCALLAGIGIAATRRPVEQSPVLPPICAALPIPTPMPTPTGAHRRGAPKVVRTAAGHCPVR
jgi:hypothetical protein